MKSLLFIAMSLFFMATTYANVFEQIQSASEQGADAQLNLTFNDGYRMNIRGPISLTPTGVTFRCPCNQYYLDFTDENGQRQRRTVMHHTLGGRFEYSGNNGQSYDVVSATPGPGGSENSRPCMLLGDYEIMNIHSRKVIENNGRGSCPVNGTISCVGNTLTSCNARFRCNNDPTYGSGTYGIYCMARNGSCPTDPYECAADEALDNARNLLQDQGFDLTEEPASQARGQ